MTEIDYAALNSTHVDPADIALLECHRLRAAEYPPMTDYLDGVVKGDQAQIDAYIAACQAVKDKYPKPIADAG